MKNIVIGEHTIKNFYLNEKELDILGEKHICHKCKKPFIIGEAELKTAKIDSKGNPKRTLEVFNSNDCVVDINAESINLAKYTIKEHAVIFGVQFVNMRYCNDCYTHNKSLPSSDEYNPCLNGKSDRCLEE
jgi:hypothetical protein